nr:PREDICTED: serine protease HTRA2, mitochondrial [Linepithema humile]XP_012222812.1 PREDICTED: serine protease HTRA2, mitochondrial [Linepithema humile]XP_012222813.1 PREDICTED: serine protease HTRA2, mitochondrial [Linepithema humile]
MAFASSRLPLVFLSKKSLNVSRFTTIVLAERYAKVRAFHSQRQARRVHSINGKGFLTCTALIAGVGFGYLLYNRRDDIRQRIGNLGVPNLPVVHTISLSSSDENRNKFNFIADVVEVCAPSVVYIEIKDNRIDPFTGKLGTKSNGSGFIVSQDGLILTNAHVVINRPNATVKVQLYDGSTYEGVIEDVDLQSDLATIRINKTNLPVMKLGTSSNIRPGEFVVAIGSPLALNNTITSGVISSVNRSSEKLGLRSQIGYIQTDAAITYGNSGGPLVNLNGETIGINAIKMASGISFAVPIDYAKEFLKKIESHKKGKTSTYPQDIPKKKYIGVTMQSLLPDILLDMQQYNEYRQVKHGVAIWKVLLGSPAYNAGLQPGDVITHANGKPMQSTSDIYKIIEESGNNSRNINFLVVRKGRVLSIQIEPEDI